MDIKAEIEKIVAKITGDNDLKEKFSQDPTGTVKGLVSEAADNDTIAKIVEAVKAALAGGKLGAIGEKISNALGGLFGKKDDAEEEKKDE